LVEALFEEAIDGIVQIAVEAASIASSWDGLVFFMERASQRQAEDLGLRDVMLHSKYGRDRVAQARDRIIPVVGRLVERAQHDGHLRTDVVAADIPIIEFMVNAVAGRTSDLAPQLWRRYLTIILDGLSNRDVPTRELPPPPDEGVVEEALTSPRAD
jgi:hypothetical protein